MRIKRSRAEEPDVGASGLCEPSPAKIRRRLPAPGSGKSLKAIIALLLLPCFVVSAATRYVWQGNPSPAPPYDTWLNAAPNIQDAVDAAQTGDTVLVTNGVYATGGRALVGTMTNRLVIDKAVTVKSVNGPEFTLIQGYQVPGTTNGDGAIRCIYLAEGAIVSGFTLTNGATRTSGDYSLERSGGGVWCESTNALVSNCVLSANSADGAGGGAFAGTLQNCTLTANWAATRFGGGYGGGASAATLNDCTLKRNWAQGSGGGAGGGTLNHCVLVENSAKYGGGAIQCTLNNCVLTRNSALFGGGALEGTLNNCTLTGNSAFSLGGGAVGSLLNNCIVYFNTAAESPNYIGDTLNYCCTTPLPSTGIGNITTDPQLVSASHLSFNSPCRGAGNAAYATGTDIDGEPWADPPSIGCDEYRPGAIGGPLSVSLVAAFTNVAVGFPVSFLISIDGRADAGVVYFGDGVTISNILHPEHAWDSAGDYAVVLTAYNDTYAQGVSATQQVHVVAQPVHYVAVDTINPMPPYAEWTTAARTIQEATDVADVPGSLVLVSNGVYATGGRAAYGGLSNRLAVDRPLRLISVNGPQLTVIQGYRPSEAADGQMSVRCVFLTSGAILSGFTLTNGSTWQGREPDYSLLESDVCGGGVLALSGAVLSNCVLVGNSAKYRGGGAYGGALIGCTLSGNTVGYGGGGADSSWLNNCVLTGNCANEGGGARVSTLTNCTLTGNAAEGDDADGAGADSCTLYNCIVYYNTNRDCIGCSDYITCYYCCTPDPSAIGIGNITNAPLFVNLAESNLHLQSESPCINAGNNSYVTNTSTDLDGNARIVGGTVDIGAYEFQSPASMISYAWLQQYGLPSDGSTDLADSDNDHMNNWQEWIADTDPTNRQSIFRIDAIEPGLPVIIQFPSSSNRLYTLFYSPEPAGTNAFGPTWTNVAGQTDRVGTGGRSSLTDSNSTALRFYRIGVRTR